MSQHFKHRLTHRRLRLRRKRTQAAEDLGAEGVDDLRPALQRVADQRNGSTEDLAVERVGEIAEEHVEAVEEGSEIVREREAIDQAGEIWRRDRERTGSALEECREVRNRDHQRCQRSRLREEDGQRDVDLGVENDARDAGRQLGEAIAMVHRVIHDFNSERGGIDGVRVPVAIRLRLEAGGAVLDEQRQRAEPGLEVQVCPGGLRFEGERSGVVEERNRARRIGQVNAQVQLQFRAEQEGDFP